MISHIGEYKNNQKNGNGVVFDRSGYPIYRGNFTEDNLCGFGLRRFGNMREYLGNFRGGLEEGKGQLFEDCGTIMQEGEWRGGRPDGFGKRYDEIGLIVYEGIFRAGIAVYKDVQKPQKVWHGGGGGVLKYFGG